MYSIIDKLKLFVISACQKSCHLRGWCLQSTILHFIEAISCQLFHVKFTQDMLLLCLYLNQKGLTCLGLSEHSLLCETIMCSCHLLIGVGCESNFESRRTLNKCRSICINCHCTNRYNLIVTLLMH